MKLRIVEYIKSLIPMIQKDDVLENLRYSRDDLEKVVCPAYREAATLFSKEGFKSDPARSIDAEVRRTLKINTSGRGPTFLTEFSRRLEFIRDNTEVLTRLVQDGFGRDVLPEGISSRKAVLLRMSENFSFVSMQAGLLLNYLLSAEAEATGAEVSPDIALSPAQIASVRANVSDLARVVEAYGIPKREFEQAITGAADVVVSVAEPGAVEGLYSDADIDPLTLTMASGFVGNPIYHVRMQIAGYQIARHRSNQEKKKLLELRILQLETLRTGEANPRLEHQIAYEQNRVDKLDRRITEFENSAGL